MSKEPNRNVYVGHRYVPKIMGEWDKSIDYEGLSIVTNQGTSYTSKKRVPVGIDILNTEFWVVTGNYNAQVEYYRQETERVAEELTGKADLQELVDHKSETEQSINDFKDLTDDNINGFKTETGQTIKEFKDLTDDNINGFKSETNQSINEFKDLTDDNINGFKSETNQSINEFKLETTGEVSHINSKLPYVSIRDYPRLESENNDDGRFKRIIDQYPNGVTIQIYNEIYETEEPIIIHDNVIIQGIDRMKSIIKNGSGNDIIRTKNPDVRHYYCGIKNLGLNGVEQLGQKGFNLTNISYAVLDNFYIENVHTGIYFYGRRTDDSIGGCYYTSAYTPLIARCEIGIHIDRIGNENTFFGGRLMHCDYGVIIEANSNKFYGMASEGMYRGHYLLKNYNNSFYGVRMEGYTDSIGIISDLGETIKNYINYFYTPHLQGLLNGTDERSGQIFIISDRGFKIPLRIGDTAVQSTRPVTSELPMIEMESGGGGGEVYRSVRNNHGKHYTAINTNGDEIFNISGYGEYVNNVPGRGIRLKSENGDSHIVRVNNNGEIEVIKL